MILLRRIKNDSHREGYKNVEIVWGDLEKPGSSKIADRHADLVLVSNLLFQVEEKKTLLGEAWRILKPTGRLAVIDWCDSYRGMGPRKKDVVKKEEAIELCRAVGFDIKEEFEAGAHHYGLIARPIALPT